MRAWESEENMVRYEAELQQSRERLDLEYASLEQQAAQAQAANDLDAWNAAQDRLTQVSIQQNALAAEEYQASRQRQHLSEMEQLRHLQTLNQLDAEGELRLAELETQQSSILSGMRQQAMFDMWSENISNQFDFANQILDQSHAVDMANFEQSMTLLLMQREYEYARRLGDAAAASRQSGSGKPWWQTGLEIIGTGIAVAV
jgi:hypothetical protein